MFDFHEKRKIRKILYSKIVFIFLFFIIVFLSSSVYTRFLVAKETKSKLEDKLENLKELEIRVETLGAKVQYLENDRGIEEELRNRFDVAKEGEQVIIILENRDIEDKNTGLDTLEIDIKKNIGTSSFLNLFKFW